MGTPTFPKARDLIGRREYEFWSVHDDEEQQAMLRGSVRPIFDAGSITCAWLRPSRVDKAKRATAFVERIVIGGWRRRAASDMTVSSCEPNSALHYREQVRTSTRHL